MVRFFHELDRVQPNSRKALICARLIGSATIDQFETSQLPLPTAPSQTLKVDGEFKQKDQSGSEIEIDGCEWHIQFQGNYIDYSILYRELVYVGGARPFSHSGEFSFSGTITDVTIHSWKGKFTKCQVSVSNAQVNKLSNSLGKDISVATAIAAANRAIDAEYEKWMKHGKKKRAW